MDDLLTALPGHSILIVGDVMLDEYIWGEVRRISPEAPVPVVEIRHRTYTPGGAANTAANVASLGGRVSLGGVVGQDQQAERLRNILKESRVNIEGLLIDDKRPTTTKTRIVAHSQQIVRVDSEQRLPLRNELEDILLRWITEQVNMSEVCVLSDYGKGVISPRIAERFIQLAREADKPVVVDPKGTDYLKYRGTTVITPNIHEAIKALKYEHIDDINLLEVGSTLTDLLTGSAVLITRGAEGMTLFQKGIEPIHIPAMARHVFDVTGAGDTVVSTLALALAAGATLEEAANLANYAAGVVVGKFGTATISLEELYHRQ